jgi:hypothetical protein
MPNLQSKRLVLLALSSLAAIFGADDRVVARSGGWRAVALSIGRVKVEGPRNIGVETSAHPAVGAILYYDGQSTGICTGTLLCDRAVLTAGHCLFALLSPGGRAWFLNDRDAWAVRNAAWEERSDTGVFDPCQHSSASCAEVSEFHINAQYLADNPERQGSHGKHNDVGMAQLATPIALGDGGRLDPLQPRVTYPAVADHTPMRCMRYTTMGYGTKSWDAATVGKKRALTAEYRGQARYAPFYSGLLKFTATPEPGDSGGPVLRVKEGATHVHLTTYGIAHGVAAWGTGYYVSTASHYAEIMRWKNSYCGTQDESLSEAPAIEAELASDGYCQTERCGSAQLVLSGARDGYVTLGGISWCGVLDGGDDELPNEIVQMNLGHPIVRCTFSGRGGPLRALGVYFLDAAVAESLRSIEPSAGTTEDAYVEFIDYTPTDNGGETDHGGQCTITYEATGLLSLSGTLSCARLESRPDMGESLGVGGTFCK